MPSFDLPSFSGAPYFEQYMGVWAIQESALQGFAEMLKTMDLNVHMQSEQAAAAIANGGKLDSQVSDNVAVVSITGSLMKQQSSMGGGTSTAMAKRTIRALANDPNIGAIVLRIDSPGGTVAGTEELAAEIANANKKKPVLAYIEDLGASAAYWVASQAREISANATALVGSIGTYGVVQDMSALAAKEGVKVHVVRAGAYKGAGVPGTEVTQGQLAEMQRTVNALNSHFLNGVANGRGMAIERVQTLADGRVHIASEAKSIGLIDHISTLDETISRAQVAARAGSKTRKPMAAAGSPVTSLRKGQSMSDTLEASVAELKPQAATIEQIEAACSGAPDSFVLSQMKRGATIDQATQAWSQEQVKIANAKAAEQAAENAKLRAELEEAKKTTFHGTTGVDAIGSVTISSSVVSSGSARETWDAAIAEKKRGGMASDLAVLTVDKENPGLREQMLHEVNSNRKPARR